MTTLYRPLIEQLAARLSSSSHRCPRKRASASSSLVCAKFARRALHTAKPMTVPYSNPTFEKPTKGAPANMTNKPRYLSGPAPSAGAHVIPQSQSRSQSPLPAPTPSSAPTPQANGVLAGGACSAELKTNGISFQSKQARARSFLSAENFHTMAGVQKLSLEPTREHIENIRELLRHIKAKDQDDQEVRLEKDCTSGIGVIRIKSAAKNGISAKMMCDFLDTIDQLYAWPEGKGVLIYGHNGFFCSGGDLVSVRELANYEDGLKMATLMQYNMSRLQSLPMITMALIQGKALGGGAEIAVSADLRVITKSAKMGYVHSRVGIVAAWGGGSRLVQLVGPSRAVELMSSGRLVGADEALNLGLVNSILDDANLSDAQVLEEAKAYLRSHCAGAHSTITAIKGLVNAARTLPLEQALVVEGQILSSIWGKPPHIDALNRNVKHRDE